ncbi:TetR/AcrR family transcriptional regulator [Actinomycetota bacterium]
MTTAPEKSEAPVTARQQAKAERVERRRSQILSAAARLMIETGYHGVTMQQVAEEAGLSVGLIYQYFGNKEDVLRAVVVDILDEFRTRVPEAMARAGRDPQKRVAAGFRAFCTVIDAKRDGALLAYRESQTLDIAGRAEIMRLERETMEPIRAAIAEGVEAGQFRAVSPELLSHNLKMIAHGWALKHWDVGQQMSLRTYVDRELDLLFASLAPTPA